MTNPYDRGSELYTIWERGYREAGGDVGVTYDDDPESERSRAYDLGRAERRKRHTRLEIALEDAQTAFWALIADRFPEVTTGDMDPPSVLAFDQAIHKAVTGWLYMNQPTITVGDRYRLRQTVDRHGCFTVPEGKTGTVVSADQDLIRLRMDEPFHDGEEWDHEIQWCNDQLGDGTPASIVFLKDCDPIDSYEDTNTGIPGLVACGTCSALVAWTDRERHRWWHARPGSE